MHLSKKRIAIYFILDMAGVLFMAIAVLLSAGRMDWWPAWAAIGVMTVNQVAVGLVLLRFQPDLMQERMNPPKTAKSWDRSLVSLLRLAQLARYILGGLDARYGWTHAFPVGVQIAGIAGCLVGYAVFAWAMGSNRNFSQVVRIQSDRGHAVASGGPYRVLRHPAYSAMILFELSMSALLGSWWAILVGIVCTILFIIRTALEDHTLKTELPGYLDYAQKVRFRLIPWIW